MRKIVGSDVRVRTYDPTMGLPFEQLRDTGSAEFTGKVTDVCNFRVEQKGRLQQAIIRLSI
jgi:hypothetical protein